MTKPYVYLSAGSSRSLTRKIGDGTRVTFNATGDGSRSLEVYVDPRGVWTLSHRPGPVHGGSTVEIARGYLPGEFSAPPGEVRHFIDQLDGRGMTTEEIRRRLAVLADIIEAATEPFGPSSVELAELVYEKIDELQDER